MNNLRKYGSEPFEVAVVHGGPKGNEKTVPDVYQPEEWHKLLDDFIENHKDYEIA